MLLKLALLAVLLEVSMASKLKYKPMSRTEGRSAFAAQFPFRNVSLDWETRVDDLVSRLTVDEVIAQLSHGGAGVNGPAPAIKRLGIGPFQWNSECLRGYAEAGPATSFPDAINLASSFDKSIVYRVAEAGAMEARAKHANYSQYGNFGDHTGINCFSPVINIVAHPLWGRAHETYGEDPALTGQFARAFVRGLMGNDSRYVRASSNCKHFAAYNGPENVPSLRFGFNAVVPEVDLRQTFLPQFEQCVKAGAHGVMCSYNSVNGIPACANKYLLTDILRNEWNFTGFVISDEGAIIMTQSFHHYYNNSLQIAVGTIESGVNIELALPVGPPVWASLTDAVRLGLIDKALLYDRVWPLFYSRMRLGEFDPPEMNPYTNYSLDLIQSAQQKNLSLLAAKKSFVLLKRSGNLLPLKANSLASLTLIGPFANTTDQFFGDYSPTPDKHNTTNVQEGLRNLVQDVQKLVVQPGCADPTCTNYDSQKSQVLAAAKSERNLLVLALGTGQINEAEANDRRTFEMPGQQPAILNDVVSIAEAAKVPIVLLLFSATAMNVSRAVESSAVVAIMQCGFAAQELGLALVHVLTMADDDSNPAGRLPYTWYRDASQLPLMTDYDMRNKTYRFMDSSVKPLFYFGFGLSYSQFQYKFASSAMSVTTHAKQLGNYRNYTAAVWVSNSGPYNGDAVIQIYVRWPDSVYADPKYQRVARWQLVAFERVSVKAGQSKTVPVLVDTKWLRLWSNGQYVVPTGTYGTFVGGSNPEDQSGKESGMLATLTVSSDFSQLLEPLAAVLLDEDV